MALQALAYVEGDYADDHEESAPPAEVIEPVVIRQIPIAAIPGLRPMLAPMIQWAVEQDGSAALKGRSAETVLADLEEGRHGLLMALRGNDVLGLACIVVELHPNGKWVDVSVLTGREFLTWMRPMFARFCAIAHDVGALGVKGDTLRGKGWGAVMERLGGEVAAVYHQFWIPLRKGE